MGPPGVIELPATDGIEVVPDERRTLGLLDQGTLWANMGVSLVGVVTAAGLIPALGFREAAAMIVVGAFLGAVLLGLSARMGAETGRPGMAILRRSLGDRGAAVPSVLNVVQLVGWSAVETWTVAYTAHALVGHGPALPYYLAAGAAGIALAIIGPLGVVRRVLRRVMTPLLLVSLAYLLVRLGARAHTGSSGVGGLSRLAALDLVIAYNASWLPLAPDYTRYTRRPRDAALGAGVGYLLGTLLVFAVGLLAAAAGSVDPAYPLASVTPLALGTLAAWILVADESEKTFANVYSAAVSAQNLLPRLSQRVAIVAVGGIATAIAYQLDVPSLFQFLFLLGAFFLPLFGAVLADRLLAADPAATLAGWAVGFLLYEWIQPTSIDALQRLVPAPLGGGSLGASLPAFGAAFAVRLAVGLARRQRRGI
jgi:putative hydroxymethylpyrimidine transporter CytX